MQQILVSPEDLGTAVRNLRKAKGLTQGDLGKLVGLDQKKVSLIENGNPNVRIDSVFRLLSALEVGTVLIPRSVPAISNVDTW